MPTGRKITSRLKHKIVRAKTVGHTSKHIAERYGISLSSVTRILAEHRRWKEREALVDFPACNPETTSKQGLPEKPKLELTLTLVGMRFEGNQLCLEFKQSEQ